MQFYDPPSGWRYGFPKEYKPLEGESLADTLRRDGYPQVEIDNGGDEYVRFWEKCDHVFQLITHSTYLQTPYEICTRCGETKDVKSGADGISKELHDE